MRLITGCVSAGLGERARAAEGRRDGDGGVTVRLGANGLKGAVGKGKGKMTTGGVHIVFTAMEADKGRVDRAVSADRRDGERGGRRCIRDP